MDALRQWVMALTGAAVISAVCMSLAPEGRVKKAVRFACGLLTLLCLAAPLAGGSTDLADRIASVRAGTEDFLSDVGESERTVTRAVIQERYEAYISDKGAQLGMEVTGVSVEVRWSTGGYWYPVSAEISCAGDGGREELGGCITSELGIGPENIYWS